MNFYKYENIILQNVFRKYLIWPFLSVLKSKHSTHGGIHNSAFQIDGYCMIDLNAAFTKQFWCDCIIVSAI